LAAVEAGAEALTCAAAAAAGGDTFTSGAGAGPGTGTGAGGGKGAGAAVARGEEATAPGARAGSGSAVSVIMGGAGRTGVTGVAAGAALPVCAVGATVMGRSMGRGRGLVSKISGNNNTPSSSNTAAPIRRLRACVRACATAGPSCDRPEAEVGGPPRRVGLAGAASAGAASSDLLRLKKDDRAMISRGGRPHEELRAVASPP